ncbi:MAG: response regulator [Magnetococcales bacterium]|nr:response regulator [Magnetococcales bacterium]
MDENRSKILIVDDERLNINVLNNILKDDYQIKVAVNGKQAIERALSDPQPDMILLDIIMPGFNGFEVCKQLKQNPDTANIPVIFITAKDSEKDEIQGLEVGAINFLTKPVRPAIVKARVKNHLTILQQRRDLEKLNKQILALSQTDGLTNIPNRRRFDEFLSQEWVRCQRSQRAVSLLMMDIDHFKLYNDHYGHAGGDSCLKQVAEMLSNTMRRPPDTIPHNAAMS